VATVTESGIEREGEVPVESLQQEVGGLRDELLALAGVAEVEVTSVGGTTESVRVRLAPDAEPALVGAEVQRVLASFGMRSRVTPGEEPAEPVLPLRVAPQPAPPSAQVPYTPSDSPLPQPLAGGLAGIRVEEGVSGVLVTALGAGGREETQVAEASPAGMAAAVVAAVGALACGQPSTMVSLTWSETEAGQVATVVMERPDGTKEAGAAVLAASPAYALAKATWRALTS
jgi:hypothetical protein